MAGAGSRLSQADLERARRRRDGHGGPHPRGELGGTKPLDTKDLDLGAKPEIKE